jgi:hypothetical protein
MRAFMGALAVKYILASFSKFSRKVPKIPLRWRCGHGGTDVKFEEIGKDTLEMKKHAGNVFDHIDVDGEVTH